MKYIFEHMVMIGLQDHTGQWWKVVEGCARCGKCCMTVATLPHGVRWHFHDEEKGCVYLGKEDDGKTYRCDLKGYRPFGCCCNSPFSALDYCSVILEKVDEPSSLL